MPDIVSKMLNFIKEEKYYNQAFYTTNELCLRKYLHRYMYLRESTYVFPLGKCDGNFDRTLSIILPFESEIVAKLG